MIDFSQASASCSERAAGQAHRGVEADAGGHGGVDERGERREASFAEHFIAVGADGTQVAAAEVEACGHDGWK
jgi:hypothetical protein